MRYLIVTVVVFAALAAGCIFVLSPSTRRKRMAAWRKTAFAHRGLHGGGVCENTCEAFERACAAGFGIELDVQLSKDGTVVVFHDDDLPRMCGDSRRVDEVDLSELQTLTFADGAHMPTFAEVLELVDGRTALLIELKNGRRNDELCRKVLEMLRAYRGKYIIESFNPLIVRWFRKHGRDILRGQLVTETQGYMPRFCKGAAWILASLGLNFLARPDFVAYNAESDFLAPKLQRKFFRTPMACWTVKTNAMYNRAREMGEMPIFEGFLPEKQ